MIQVIHRAVDILEFLATDGGNPKSLSEIAGHTTLNAGTCANIIKTLTSRGCIEKLEEQRTYILGPLFYKLTGEGSFKTPLIEAAKAELQKLTGAVNESTLIGILKGDTRVAVVVEEGSSDLTVQSNEVKKAYNTATGRLLIANLPDVELERFVEKYGLPAAGEWKEVKTKKALAKEVDTIRSAGYAEHITESEIIGMAVPVYKRDTVVASVGIYMPLFRYRKWKGKKVLNLLKACATAIGQKLS